MNGDKNILSPSKPGVKVVAASPLNGSNAVQAFHVFERVIQPSFRSYKQRTESPSFEEVTAVLRD